MVAHGGGRMTTDELHELWVAGCSLESRNRSSQLATAEGPSLRLPEGVGAPPMTSALAWCGNTGLLRSLELDFFQALFREGKFQEPKRLLPQYPFVSRAVSSFFEEEQLLGAVVLQGARTHYCSRAREDRRSEFKHVGGELVPTNISPDDASKAHVAAHGVSGKGVGLEGARFALPADVRREDCRLATGAVRRRVSLAGTSLNRVFTERWTLSTATDASDFEWNGDIPAASTHAFARHDIIPHPMFMLYKFSHTFDVVDALSLELHFATADVLSVRTARVPTLPLFLNNPMVQRVLKKCLEGG